jgi:hypothetical protein
VDKTGDSEKEPDEDYGGRFTSEFSWQRLSTVWVAVCGHALLGNNAARFDNSPQHLIQVTDFN